MSDKADTLEEVNNMEGTFDIPKLMRVLSEVLSDKYNMEITLTARLKEDASNDSKASA